MGDASARGLVSRSYAKEYARFCRIYGLFLVNGLEVWRAALEARGIPGNEIKMKISAAAEFVRRMGDPPIEL